MNNRLDFRERIASDMKPYKPLKQEADRDEALSYSDSPTDKDDYRPLERNIPASRWRRWPVAEVALVALVLSNLAWTLNFMARRTALREMDYCKLRLINHLLKVGRN